MTPFLKNLVITAFVACCIILTTSFYLQFIQGYEPCPLCIMQRLLLTALAAVFFINALHDAGKLGTRIYGGVAFVLSILGAASASRQLWLHHFPPPPDSTCAPSMEYLMRFFSMSDVIEALIKGNGECAHVEWTFLGISIPGWSFISFAIFACFSLFVVFKAKARHV